MILFTQSNKSEIERGKVKERLKAANKQNAKANSSILKRNIYLKSLGGFERYHQNVTSSKLNTQATLPCTLDMHCMQSSGVTC